jgi:hypothetical protein
MFFQSWAVAALSATSFLDGAFAFTNGRGKFVERSHRHAERGRKEVEKRKEAERLALEARQANCTQDYRFYNQNTSRELQAQLYLTQWLNADTM